MIDKADTAIADVSTALSYIGSVTNRLNLQGNSMGVALNATIKANSIIEDADMAFEQVEVTKLQILQQTSSAMLAQANISPQIIMSLFK